jgi:hypothetical protein
MEKSAHEHLRLKGGNDIFLDLSEGIDTDAGKFIVRGTAYMNEYQGNLRVQNISFPILDKYPSFEEAKKAFDELVEKVKKDREL